MSLFNKNDFVQKTKYKVDDNSHRDVFDQIDLDRKSVQNNKRAVDKPTWMMYSVLGIFIWFMVLGLGMIVYRYAHAFMNVSKSGLSGYNISYGDCFVYPWTTEFQYWYVSYLGILAAIGISYLALSYVKSVNNQVTDASHLNTYSNDGRLMQPEELPGKFDFFPDAGAHSSVEATAILSHMMFNNSGLKTIDFPQRYEKTILDEPDETGHREPLHYAGEPILDDDGNVVTKKLPIFDSAFSQKLFDSSLTPEAQDKRIIYDPRQILYNPKGDILGKDKSKTVAEFINKDWHFPEYEVQRPGGAYIVDTDPNNTMLLAMTRAGKGQDIIEPTIDMWLRMDKPGNVVVNDPKGELYRKFYYPASKRGFEVISFNLINDSRTNIYNPMGYAVEAARKDDNSKVEEYVKAIGDVFFPTENADDPMWPNAANATFKRSALGLIDYYKEEDMELRERARQENWNDVILNQKEDELWGHVTPYNVYQMMTQLASKKSSDASFIHIAGSDDDSEDKDYLTLFFDATDALPKNELRTSVGNEDNSLRAMAGSDKTISSVYGISLTAVKFFADEKIRNLTSGLPSQNFDMVGLAFPRRIEVRFDTSYLVNNSMEFQRYHFSAYADENFTQPLGKDFDHDGTIDNHGWLIYAFKGIFPDSKAYIKLEIFGADDDLLMHRYFFKFTKDYQTSLDGNTFVHDPVSEERIVRNGTIQEMRKFKRLSKDGSVSYVYRIKPTTYDLTDKSLILDDDGDSTSTRKMPVISQTDVHYTEKPRIIFCVTPPHMMSYAKLILIMLNQMFNMQVDKAYLTKANQKPLYMTRYMLDEIGNLQSEGNGIPFLQTKESIGLGQSQQYTLILQTLQQLRDIYGDSIDKILQANTSNIVYLKSTDTTMLEELQKMSGVRHESHADSQSSSFNVRKPGLKADSQVNVTTSIKEVPVISINDMLRIPRNSDMVFGHGDPIWSINQTALPMSWQLHMNQVRDVTLPDGYSLLTVPSISNTAEFDTLKNQPDFVKMVTKRVEQANIAGDVLIKYKETYGIKTDDQLSKLDPETLSKTLMAGINANMRHRALTDASEAEDAAAYMVNDSDIPDDEDFILQTDGGFDAVDSMLDDKTVKVDAMSQDNTELKQAQQAQTKLQDDFTEKKYAQYTLSLNELFAQGKPRQDIKATIVQAYENAIPQFENDNNFRVDSYGNLRGSYGGQDVIFIKSVKDPTYDQLADLKAVQQTAVEDIDPNDLSAINTYDVQDVFIEFLGSLESWSHIASGKFDIEMAAVYRRENDI